MEIWNKFNGCVSIVLKIVTYVMKTSEPAKMICLVFGGEIIGTCGNITWIERKKYDCRNNWCAGK